MTNILAPYSESKNLKASYEANGLINNGTNGVEDIAFDFVIPVYNKFLVNSIGDAGGITITTTSNSLPLCFMNSNCICMF